MLVESDRQQAHRELVQGVVPRLGGSKEEAGLEHAQGGADGHRVEVLDGHLGHGAAAVLERHAVDVPVLALRQAGMPVNIKYVGHTLQQAGMQVN